MCHAGAKVTRLTMALLHPYAMMHTSWNDWRGAQRRSGLKHSIQYVQIGGPNLRRQELYAHLRPLALGSVHLREGHTA